MNEPNIDWFRVFTDRMRDYSEGNIWTNGDEILVRTEESADAVADLIATLYRGQGQQPKILTGFYDPEEDRRTGKTDRHTGWHHIQVTGNAGMPDLPVVCCDMPCRFGENGFCKNSEIHITGLENGCGALDTLCTDYEPNIQEAE